MTGKDKVDYRAAVQRLVEKRMQDGLSLDAAYRAVGHYINEMSSSLKQLRMEMRPEARAESVEELREWVRTDQLSFSYGKKRYFRIVAWSSNARRYLQTHQIIRSSGRRREMEKSGIKVPENVDRASLYYEVDEEVLREAE